jgi:hypothetical protein
MQTFQQEMLALRANEQAARDTIAALTQEVEAGKAAIATAQADVTQMAANYAAKVAEMDGKVATLQAGLDAALEMVKASEEVAKAKTQEVEQLERKLALVPAMADVSDGAPVVPAGGEAGDGVDLVTKVEGMKGAERIAFYRANQAAIDAAYARKQRK